MAIGSNVQAYDAGLAAIAGLATTDGGIIVGNGSTFPHFVTPKKENLPPWYLQNYVVFSIGAVTCSFNLVSQEVGSSYEIL